MAKRQRGSTRPGQRAPAPRVGRRPTEAPGRPRDAVTLRPSQSLTADEEARAAEIEAQILAEERAAEEATRRARERARSGEAGRAPARAGSNVPLSVRAAEEYAYVRRDVVRIARIAALLLGILAVLYVLINVAGIITF